MSANLGLDATAPFTDDPMAFRRIRVKGEEEVDLQTALEADPPPPSPA